MLTTDQTTTLLKTLMIFIENKDPFTVESITNEIKRNGDVYDGFHNDKGECIVEDYWDDINKLIDDTIKNLYHEWFDDFQTVYVFRPDWARNVKDDDYEEEIIDEYEVDKEGNRLPDREEVYDDSKEDGLLPGEYYNENGEIEWDRDAAESARYEEDEEFFANYGQEPKIDDEKEFHDPDHPIIYKLKVDKQKRINIKKAIFKEAGWADDEEVVIISQAKDHSQFFIARKKDCDDDIINLVDEEYVNGDYFLKDGALRIGTVGLFDDIEPGEIVKAKVGWEDDFNYIQVGFDI